MAKEGWEAWRPGSRPAMPGLAKVVGHRGARARAPENTLAGLRKAAELGATWVEFDVMLTADGVPVLMHDDTLDRTTNGQGSTAAITLAELSKLDAGGYFSAAFANERVPTFKEAIDILIDLHLAANVEIKPVPGHERQTAHAVAQILADSWPAIGPDLLISSFSKTALTEARATAPALAYGLLVEEVPANWASLMQELGCTSLHAWHEKTAPEEVASIAAEGVPVLLYTVNDPSCASAFLKAGAASIITDVPDLILPAVDHR
ncbi:glycerophosphoryl diester phosphodiesterase [Arboricoccus pini]|uniref:Glycerophosphoryl diester phosphodiesterase n=1 Tax=Arboricoccus pini TaxID=1963835 RepID=A0A212QP71_9PROT|nr:glycerophosphodiester phosphodiesterase [Arboricoccus pini]SNB61198.1 glycerophosphoryl diester phosphodiesterase [Arboricoccus pini]